MLVKLLLDQPVDEFLNDGLRSIVPTWYEIGKSILFQGFTRGLLLCNLKRLVFFSLSLAH